MKSDHFSLITWLFSICHMHMANGPILTQLHSQRPKLLRGLAILGAIGLSRVLAILSAIGLSRVLAILSARGLSDPIYLFILCFLILTFFSNQFIILKKSSFMFYQYIHKDRQLL